MPFFPTSSCPPVWGGGLCLTRLGKQPSFTPDVSSPAGTDTAPYAAPRRPLQCPVPLGVRMGGDAQFAGGRGVRPQLHRSRKRGAELASLPVGAGWTAPPFPILESQRKSTS